MRATDTSRAQLQHAADVYSSRSQRPVPAGERMLAAARMDIEAVAGGHGDPHNHALANAIRENVRSSVPQTSLTPVPGGELVSDRADDVTPALKNTLAKPDYVAVDASRDRLELAKRAGVLETALDAADTIEATNSLERMLAHQLAAIHRSTMVLAEQANRRLERMTTSNLSYPDLDAKIVDAATKLTHAMARSSLAFQQGLLTIQKLRSGNSQRIIVQHVTVKEGGQAVVAAEIPSGGLKPMQKRAIRTRSQNG